MSAVAEVVTKTDLETIAKRECLELLAMIRDGSFMSAESVESLAIYAFTRGAAWALGIDVEAARAPKN